MVFDLEYRNIQREQMPGLKWLKLVAHVWVRGSEILTAGQIQEGTSLLPALWPVISYPWIFPAQTAWQHRPPAKSPSNSFLFPFPWIRHGFPFDLKTDSILVILVSILAEKALSWSQENKLAATVQWPKSLVCKDDDSGEQGSNSKRDHQGREDHSTQSLSKASHLSWIQHRDSMMKHQNKESRNTDKASPQQWVFNRAKSSESSKKPGSPEQ